MKNMMCHKMNSLIIYCVAMHIVTKSYYLTNGKWTIKLNKKAIILFY